MPELRFVQIHRGLGFKGWAAVVLALAVIAGVAIAVAVVAVSLFLIFIPVMIVVAFAYYLVRRFSRRSRPTGEPGIIEGEFRILNAEDQQSNANDGRQDQ
jgi:membrane protein DedA with SNARE-associated domain